MSQVRSWALWFVRVLFGVCGAFLLSLLRFFLTLWICVQLPGVVPNFFRVLFRFAFSFDKLLLLIL